MLRKNSFSLSSSSVFLLEFQPSLLDRYVSVDAKFIVKVVGVDVSYLLTLAFC